MLRERCGGCGSTALKTFLDLGQTPLAGDFVTQDSDPQQWMHLALGACEECWLVQQMWIVDDDELFTEEYPSTSSFDAQYHQELAKLLMERHEEQLNRGPVVEIGSNDGDLLQHFDLAGHKSIGIDPAANVGMRSPVYRTFDGRFNLALARKIKKQEGEAGLIIVKNTVDRVENLDNFFSGLNTLLSPFGLVIIETPYLGSMILGNQFAEVMHERRYHFSIDAIWRLGEQHGLFVENVEMRDGNMRLTLGRNGPSFGVTELRREEEWLRLKATYDGVQGRVNFIKERIVELVEREKIAGRRVAAFGATNEGMTLLMFCGLNANKIEYVVDPTLTRAGTATPGAMIPVVKPGELPSPDTYVLLAWNYLGQMLRAGSEFLNHGGRFLVPLPNPFIV